jgi:hypothetical protein
MSESCCAHKWPALLRGVLIKHITHDVPIVIYFFSNIIIRVGKRNNYDYGLNHGRGRVIYKYETNKKNVSPDTACVRI